MIVQRKMTPLQPYGYLTITVRRRDGSVRSENRYVVDSLTRNFWLYFHLLVSAHSSFVLQRSILNQDRSLARTSTTQGYRMTSQAGAGELPGIQLGTGDTAMQLFDESLESRILHGTLEGRLVSGAMNFTLLDTGVRMIRVFDNNSGATIDVREAGVHLNSSSSFGSANYNNSNYSYLHVRDVLPEAIPVPDGEAATVQYEMFFGSGNRNLHRYWQAYWGGPTAWTATTYLVSGGTSSIDIRNIQVDAGVGQTRGIYAGTGDTPSTVNDITLADEISHGTDPGQLLYLECSITSLSISNATGIAEFDVTRIFTNDSGADITIRELGLFGNTATNNINTRYLLDRYVLPTPVTIPAGESRAARWMFYYSI